MWNVTTVCMEIYRVWVTEYCVYLCRRGRKWDRQQKQRKHVQLRAQSHNRAKQSSISRGTGTTFGKSLYARASFHGRVALYTVSKFCLCLHLNEFGHIFNVSVLPVGPDDDNKFRNSRIECRNAYKNVLKCIK